MKELNDFKNISCCSSKYANDIFNRLTAIGVFFTAIALLGCNSPIQSQKYFARAVKDDPILEPIHQTALYTVFFDHALRRCVLHSSYTWGESGGGTGGTGLGVTIFNCNPQALKAHVENLRQQIDDGAEYFELPVPKMRNSTTPSRQAAPSAPKPAPQKAVTSPATEQHAIPAVVASPASTQPEATTSVAAPPTSERPNTTNSNSNPPTSDAPNASSPYEQKSTPLLQPVFQPQGGNND